MDEVAGAEAVSAVEADGSAVGAVEPTMGPDPVGTSAESGASGKAIAVFEELSGTGVVGPTIDSLLSQRQTRREGETLRGDQYTSRHC